MWNKNFVPEKEGFVKHIKLYSAICVCFVACPGIVEGADCTQFLPYGLPLVSYVALCAILTQDTTGCSREPEKIIVYIAQTEVVNAPVAPLIYAVVPARDFMHTVRQPRSTNN